MPDRLGDKVRLLHIKDSIKKIEDYVNGVRFDEFESNSMMTDACIRQLSVIGEACNRLSDELKTSKPEIDWRKIVRLRNIVIHQYFGVDHEIIWDVIQHNLSELKNCVETILEDLERETDDYTS